MTSNDITTAVHRDVDAKLPTEQSTTLNANSSSKAPSEDEHASSAAEIGDEKEEEMEYPQAGKLVMILIALALSMFLVSLDMTIISTAIPRITDQFHSLDDVGWYGTAFFLTLAR